MRRGPWTRPGLLVLKLDKQLFLSHQQQRDSQSPHPAKRTRQLPTLRITAWHASIHCDLASRADRIQHKWLQIWRNCPAEEDQNREEKLNRGRTASAVVQPDPRDKCSTL